jgi:hypothetical protein
MEIKDLVLVRTNTTGNNVCFEVCTILEETSNGWILVGEPGIGYDPIGSWCSPENVIKRWTEKSGKFDHNAIPVGSLAVRTYRDYDPRKGQAENKKFIGLVVEKKGAKYRLMRGSEIISAPWQSVRPFDPAIDCE